LEAQKRAFCSPIFAIRNRSIDRALYLPKAWTDDKARLAAAHVPPETGFATKPALACTMIERAIAAKVPFAWVAADSVYGVGEVEMALRRAAKGYVLGVSSNYSVKSWGKGRPPTQTASSIAQALLSSDWVRLSAGEGTKGQRLYDWAYLELADLDASEYNPDQSGLWARGLLIRRNTADGGLAFFSTWAPAGTPIETLVRVEGRRWAIEDGFETAKNELGLDHNETRSWHGWHRHVSLVMLAFAMMAAIRSKANAMPPPKTRRKVQRRSVGPFRKSAALPQGWPSGAFSQPALSHGPYGAAPIRPPLREPIVNKKCNCNARQG
jgi:SRSO17 transposase